MMLEYMNCTNLYFFLQLHSDASTLSSDFHASTWSQNVHPFFWAVSEFKQDSCRNKCVGFFLTYLNDTSCVFNIRVKELYGYFLTHSLKTKSKEKCEGLCLCTTKQKWHL